MYGREFHEWREERLKRDVLLAERLMEKAEEEMQYAQLGMQRATCLLRQAEAVESGMFDPDILGRVTPA